MAEEHKATMVELVGRLSIDVGNLIEECAEQSVLIERAATLAADLKFAAKTQSLRAALKRAELDKDIRTNLNDYGFDKKPPEDAIKNLIASDAEIKAIETVSLMEQHDADKASAVASAFHDRGRMLKTMADLMAIRAFGGGTFDHTDFTKVESARKDLAKSTTGEKK
jgi:hypothetical protein